MKQPIDASANGRFLQLADGSPFFWLADTAWQLFHRLDLSDAELYLERRAQQGYTVVQAVATGIHESWVATPNRNGHPPFAARDILKPVEAYWRHVDRILELARTHRLLVALLPLWSANAVTSPPGLLTHHNARAFGQWIGGRYREAGVIWVLGGDINPIWFDDIGAAGRGENITSRDFRPVFDELALGIREGAGDESFLTYHPTPISPADAPRPRTSAFLADRAWLDLNMIQSAHAHLDDVDGEGGAHISSFGGAYYLSSTSNHLAIAAEYASQPVRPVIDGEPHYEGHPKIEVDGHGSTSGECWSAHEVRTAAYHAVFAGAAGHTYGHVSVWDFFVRAHGVTNPYFSGEHGRDDWPEALDAEGSTQMRHLKNLMLAHPYFSRVPDDSIVLSAPANGPGTAHVSATRDADGSYAMIYLPHGGEITVATNALTGTHVRAIWFDPRTGERNVAATTRQGAPITLTAPGSGAEADWVLVLESGEHAEVASGA
jgi:hypothetical protein